MYVLREKKGISILSSYFVLNSQNQTGHCLTAPTWISIDNWGIYCENLHRNEGFNSPIEFLIDVDLREVFSLREFPLIDDGVLNAYQWIHKQNNFLVKITRITRKYNCGKIFSCLRGSWTRWIIKVILRWENYKLINVKLCFGDLWDCF